MEILYVISSQIILHISGKLYTCNTDQSSWSESSGTWSGSPRWFDLSCQGAWFVIGKIICSNCYWQVHARKNRKVKSACRQLFHCILIYWNVSADLCQQTEWINGKEQVYLGWKQCKVSIVWQQIYNNNSIL